MRYAPVAAFVFALSLANIAVAQPTEAHSSIAATVDRGTLEARALVLNTEIEALQAQLTKAITQAGNDRSKADEEMKALLLTFQPALDDFIETYIQFYDGLLANAADDPARESLVAERDHSLQALKSMPQALREHALNPPDQSPSGAN